MKKIFFTLLFMMTVLTMSLSTYAQDNKGSETSKAKTEQVGEKSGKACCTEKKDKACCANKDKTSCEKKSNSNACCAGKDKSTKTTASNATTETKSCGKKVD